MWLLGAMHMGKMGRAASPPPPILDGRPRPGAENRPRVPWNQAPAPKDPGLRAYLVLGRRNEPSGESGS